MTLPGPDTRVVELRVAGLVGVTGEQLLDSVATVTVAGDDSSELVRPADRLRRPAPGPVLQALGRSLPRTLEGYLWAKMTSGGALQATWALLFPFSLVNVAHGMLPVPSGGFGHALAAVCQAMLRVIGLLLTALLITQIGQLSLDLLATQCLPSDGCLDGVPSWLAAPAVRMIIGMAPPLLIVAGLHRVSAVSWRNTGAADSEQVSSRKAGDALRPNPNAPVLRGLHTLTALLCIALLPLGGPFTAPDGGGLATVLWMIADVTLILAVVFTAALDDLARWLRLVLRPQVRAVLITGALILVTLAGLAGMDLTDRRSGMDAMAEGFLAALLLAWLVFAALLIPVALLARAGVGGWRHLPTRLRPWLGGWAAAPTSLLGCLIGAGFGAGLSISVRELLGENTVELPQSYANITLLWGMATVLGALLWLGFYLIAVPMRRRRRAVPRIVRMLQEDPEELRAAANAWAKATVERKHLHRLVAAAVLLLGALAGGLAAQRLTGRTLPTELDVLQALGVLALGLLAAALLRAAYTAARRAERSRHFGALADLVYFWPRRAHPIVPPSYALKVVPDLVERARHHLREPNTRVVLAGYSHGGLLAMIAAARLTGTATPDEAERIGLLTAGTPAQWGYQRAFPGLLPPSHLAALYRDLDGRWRGLCRGTDPFGGGVTTWRHQIVDGKLLGIGYTTDGDIGPLPAAVTGPTGALVIGGDHWLPDPVREPEVDRRWAPGVRKHADYLVDPEWDRAVAVAAGLQRPDSPAFGEQPPLPLFDLPRAR